MLFGVLSLLVVVAVVGLLAKKQLSSVTAPLPVVLPGAAVGTAPASAASPQQRVQQVQRAVQDAMQQARPMPDDK